MNLQVGIFVALLVVEFFAISIDRKLGRIIDLLKEIKNVKVVKCRECIGQSTWYNDPEYGCAICGMSGMYLKSEDGYCSYGLRKGCDENG